MTLTLLALTPFALANDNVIHPIDARGLPLADAAWEGVAHDIVSDASQPSVSLSHTADSATVSVLLGEDPTVNGALGNIVVAAAMDLSADNGRSYDLRLVVDGPNNHLRVEKNTSQGADWCSDAGELLVFAEAIGATDGRVKISEASVRGVPNAVKLTVTVPLAAFPLHEYKVDQHTIAVTTSSNAFAVDGDQVGGHCHQSWAGIQDRDAFETTRQPGAGS